MDNVNPKQRQAIVAVQGPVMVVAGPGSGKTRVLTYRIAHLISIGVPAYQILALTFTNKAANEMRERIVALVGDKSRPLWMGTFHSMFARILRTECDKLGYTRAFSIYDAQDSLALIKTVMGDLGIPLQQYNPPMIRARISGAKNQLVFPDEYARAATGIVDEKVALVYAAYQERLRLNNAMDFDDLLLKPVELFGRHKKILAHYQDRFRFILIDEYQDTNRAQYVLIKQLAGQYRNICVVGDDAQSIYAFRGADIRNILDFERDYPDATIVRLEQNYRSTKTILAAADRVIKHNVDQIAKDLWTDNQEGEKITVISCEEDRDEGEAILDRIAGECRGGSLHFRDIAVMYRTNAQSRSIEDALRKAGIPYVIIGGVEFYQRKEVKDVLAYLRILANRKDDESFLRIVNYPNRGIGDVALARLRQFARKNGLSLSEAAARAGEIDGMTPKAAAALHALAVMLEKYRDLNGEMRIGEIARALVDETGMLPLLKEQGTPESMGRWENIHELLGAISEFASEQADATLETFLQEVSLVADVDRWDDKANAVTLLTLHSAKGLEFQIVFITGLEEGLLPFYTTSPDAKDLEEERRLYYVGITRAMKKLYLSHARTRYRFSELSYQSPSRFLTEIPDELLERVNVGRAAFAAGPGMADHGRRRQVGRARSPGFSDAKYFADEMPDYEHDGHPPTDVKVGAMVEHEIFGRGKILQLSGTGDALKAVVNFTDAGRKSLMLKYARLKVL